MTVFISYRHSDSEGEARAIFNRLSDRLGRDEVILDVEHRLPGKNLVEKTRAAMSRCDQVLVIIGPAWLDAEADGHRRLDDPDDIVRLEVVLALRSHRTKVIPVLVRHAEMPSSHNLPSDIEHLSKREALEVSSSRFDYDMEQLILALGGAAPAPHKEPLKSVVEGRWVVEIRNQFGQVQLMDLSIETKAFGRRRFQAKNKVGPSWSAQGTWEVLPEGQLVLKGVQILSYPFPQQGPYEAYVTFSSVEMHRLVGTTFAGETITWQRTS